MDDASNPKVAKPYNWGMFQGFALLIISPLLAIDAIGGLSSVFNGESGTAALRVGYTLVAVALFFTGLGIVQRKRYGLFLVYGFLFLIAAMVVVGFFQNGADGAHEAAAGAGVWVMSTIYYHKRRSEFR